MATTKPNPAPDEDARPGQRVLVLAPFGGDADAVRRVLSDAGLDVTCCTDVEALCREIGRGAAAALLTEEALGEAARGRLTAALAEQPAWSDFPLLVMTSRTRKDGDGWQAVQGIEGTAYLSLLERPLHTSTLVLAVRTAVRARARQYQVRDELMAREQAEEALRRSEQELMRLNRTLERRVTQRTADLAERNEELQHFAYIASHDLREPLRKVQAFAGLLKEELGAGLGKDGSLFLERMRSAAVRMDGLLNDLLTLSRVATHAQPFTEVRLGELIADVLAAHELTISETGAEVEVQADVTLEADPVQLRQLMNHLVGNALKFRREGVAPRVRIRATEVAREELSDVEGPVCRITVEDNGIGFDKKYQERIFEPFERLHGRGVYEGTGMGLAICGRIVRRHRGRITAESTPEEGSRFTIELPMRQPD